MGSAPCPCQLAPVVIFDAPGKRKRPTSTSRAAADRRAASGGRVLRGRRDLTGPKNGGERAQQKERIIRCGASSVDALSHMADGGIARRHQSTRLRQRLSESEERTSMQ